MSSVPIRRVRAHLTRYAASSLGGVAPPVEPPKASAGPPSAAGPALPAEGLTRTSRFKAWFGDWQGNRAASSKVVHPQTSEPLPTHPVASSKVVDEAGKPRVVYHGTSRGGFQEFDPARVDEHALYGPGFYFTEDPEVARTYTHKDRPAPQLSRGVDEDDVARVGEYLAAHPADVRNPNPVDNLRIFFEDPRERPAQRKYAVARTLLHKPDDPAVQALAKRLGIVVKSATPEVKSAYLNIRRPFDADRDRIPHEAIGPRAVAERERDIARLTEHADWLRHQADLKRRNGFDPAADEMGLKNIDRAIAEARRGLTYDDASLLVEGGRRALNESLRRQGYHGITHIGGVLTGGKRHRVWIAFHPAQVKATTNRGTFEPTDMRITHASDWVVVRHRAVRSHLVRHAGSSLGGLQGGGPGGIRETGQPGLHVLATPVAPKGLGAQGAGVGGQGSGTGDMDEARNAVPVSAAPPAQVLTPDPFAQGVARSYARSAGIHADHPDLDYRPLDLRRAKAIADAYHAGRHIPTEPSVRRSYDALKHETRAQYDHLVRSGVSLEPWTAEGQPYADSDAMRQDALGNRHLHYFVGGNLPSDHPLAAHSGLMQDGRHLTHNDLFRAVHDYFGHAVYGNQFGPRGEEHAWRAHARMFTRAARPAMTTETRGQNSWVNFGPHLRDPWGRVYRRGEPGYVAPPDRPYADQKAMLLPPEHTVDTDAFGRPMRYALGDPPQDPPWTDVEEQHHADHHFARKYRPRPASSTPPPAAWPEDRPDTAPAPPPPSGTPATGLHVPAVPTLPGTGPGPLPAFAPAPPALPAQPTGAQGAQGLQGDADEPDAGQPSALGFASPETREGLSYDDAVRASQSDTQRKWLDVCKAVDLSLGMHGEVATAIGDWAPEGEPPGAEPSSVTRFGWAPDFDAVKYSMAVKGRLGDQKAVLPFRERADGTDVLYELDLPATMTEARVILDQHGLAYRTLQDVGKGRTRVYLFDKGAGQRHLVEQVATHYGIRAQRRVGYGEFFPANAADRESAQREYERYAAEYERKYPDRPHWRGLDAPGSVLGRRDGTRWHWDRHRYARWLAAEGWRGAAGEALERGPAARPGTLAWERVQYARKLLGPTGVPGADPEPVGVDAEPGPDLPAPSAPEPGPPRGAPPARPITLPHSMVVGVPPEVGAAPPMPGAPPAWREFPGAFEAAPGTPEHEFILANASPEQRQVLGLEPMPSADRPRSKPAAVGGSFRVEERHLPPRYRGTVSAADLAALASPESYSKLLGHLGKLVDGGEIKALAEAGVSTRGQYDAFARVLADHLPARDFKAWGLANAVLSAQSAWQAHTMGAMKLVNDWAEAGYPGRDRPDDLRRIIEGFRDAKDDRGKLLYPMWGSGDENDPGDTSTDVAGSPDAGLGPKGKKLFRILGDLDTADRATVAGTGRTAGFGKTPEFFTANLPGPDAVVIDTHGSKVTVPDLTDLDWDEAMHDNPRALAAYFALPRRARGSVEQLLKTGDRSIAKAVLARQQKVMGDPAKYLAFKMATVRAAREMGWKAKEVQEAFWSTVIAAMVLKKHGVSDEDVLPNLTHETVKQAWDLDALLKNKGVRHEFRRAGIPERVLEGRGAAGQRGGRGRGAGTGIATRLPAPRKGAVAPRVADAAAFHAAVRRLPAGSGPAGAHIVPTDPAGRVIGDVQAVRKTNRAEMLRAKHGRLRRVQGHLARRVRTDFDGTKPAPAPAPAVGAVPVNPPVVERHGYDPAQPRAAVPSPILGRTYRPGTWVPRSAAHIAELHKNIAFHAAKWRDRRRRPIVGVPPHESLTAATKELHGTA